MQFRKIAEVESCPAQTQVDVVCVVESVGEAGTLTKRDQTETFKRNVVIRDDSNRSIELTLWGGHANNPGDQLSTVSPLSPEILVLTSHISLTNVSRTEHKPFLCKRAKFNGLVQLSTQIPRALWL